MKRHLNKPDLTRFLQRFRPTPHPHLLAGILFFALTLGMTWPLITKINTHVTPGQQPAMAVPYLNLWTLAWNHRWIRGQTPSYWDANLFYPHQKTLAYSEPQLATGVLTAPLVFFGGNTVLAYNTALLGFIWGAGMAAYALCWWLLGTFEKDSRKQIRTTKVTRRYRWLSAVTTGILYGFNFYMFREIGVLQLLAILFPPLTFLGIHRFFHQHKWSDVLIFSVSFLGCWYTCAYYGIFLSIFVPCFVIRLGQRNLLCRKMLTKAVVALTLLIVCLTPLIYGMWSAKTVMGLDRPEFIVRELSAVFKEYLKLPQQSWLYGSILRATPGQSLFLGGVLMCLASLGAVVIFLVKYNKTPTIKTHPLLQRHGKFYLFMALLAFLLSLGMALAPRPSIELGIYQFLVWLSPYNLLYNFLPGFSSIRSPHRFGMFVFLFLALLAGYGMFWLSHRVRPEWRRILVPFLIIVTIFELWPLSLRLVKVPHTVEELPPIYAHVRKLPLDSVLLELPIVLTGSEQELEINARQTYFSTFHWLPLVNGYSGFIPQASIELADIVLKASPEVVFSGLKAFGVQYVLAHTDELPECEAARLRQLETKGLKFLYREGNDFLYQVDYGNITESKRFPDTAAVRIYESQKSRSSVTLCFYYQIATHQSVLTTPWQNPIECEVAWYRTADSQKGESEPVLMSQVSYHGSKLLTVDSNAIETELPAPPPGEYQVIVRQPSGKKMSLLCHVHSSGFVTFHGEK